MSVSIPLGESGELVVVSVSCGTAAFFVVPGGGMDGMTRLIFLLSPRGVGGLNESDARVGWDIECPTLRGA
jgi:hypothetical protein